MRASPSRAGRGCGWRRPISVGETKYAYALQVLARLFGGTETSRLSRVLVERAQGRPVGLGVVQPVEPRPHLVRHRRASREVAQPDRRRGGGDGRDEEAARRRRHGRGGRAGAEPAPGGRHLLAGFAGERPAHLRHGAEHRQHGGRHRRLAAAHLRRHAGRGAGGGRSMSGATMAPSRRCSRPPRAAE